MEPWSKHVPVLGKTGGFRPPSFIVFDASAHVTLKYTKDWSPLKNVCATFKMCDTLYGSESLVLKYILGGVQ